MEFTAKLLLSNKVITLNEMVITHLSQYKYKVNWRGTSATVEFGNDGTPAPGHAAKLLTIPEGPKKTDFLHKLKETFGLVLNRASQPLGVTASAKL